MISYREHSRKLRCFWDAAKSAESINEIYIYIYNKITCVRKNREKRKYKTKKRSLRISYEQLV